jgi:hypothetical protein
MSEQAIRTFSADSAQASPLTAQQWQGLARLGDLANLLVSAVDTPAGGILAQQAGKIVDGYLSYDVPELLQDVLETLRSLRESGLLDALKDNAGLIMQTLELAKVLLDETWPRVEALDIESLETLSHLQANGALALLRESSDCLSDILASVDKRELVTETLRRVEKLPVIDITP